MSAEIQSADLQHLEFPDTGERDRWIRSYLEQKRNQGPVVFLDSQLHGHSASGKSFIAADPVCSISARDDKIEIEHKTRSGTPSGTPATTETFQGNAWKALQSFRDKYPEWMFGWLAYDLKNHTESLISRHPDPVDLPDLYFFVPGTLLQIEPVDRTITVLKGEPEQLARHFRPSRDKLEISKPVSGDGWEAYREKIRQAKEYIRLGDTYELNLTHQLHASIQGDSLDLYNRMKQNGPVPFGAWLSWGDTGICCASPERFLQRRGDKVRSQPIKGTSPRGDHAGEDEKIIRDILQKEKNRAENVMIVDLVRNDLARIAVSGSVRVGPLFEVQSFSTVHQLVSTIHAEVTGDTLSVDVLKACFPMGSMTGAPKIRTMEIIEELESYRRGIYSGAIGYFAPDDDFDFNVVIRTAIVKNNRLFYSVGGAITADSDPDDEWEESWLKARALPVGLSF